MLEKLFSKWRQSILLKEALKETEESFEKVRKMFLISMKLVFENEEKADEVYQMDKEINTLQVDIRKKLLEHLTINPQQDITECLLLITIIIDVERLGDYSKNIVEIPQLYHLKLKEDSYLKVAKETREKLESLFQKTEKVFMEADKKEAKLLTNEYTKINYLCDKTILKLTQDSTITSPDAISFTLLFRYFKRISSHLRNIATSVINPFYNIGYKPEE
jgi:phosphate uptake regulator